MDDVKTIRLPEKLNTAAAEPLFRELIAARGSAVMLDARDVVQLGSLCCQVLISAKQTWAADNVNLTFDEVPQPFRESLESLGLPSNILIEGS